MKRDLADLGRWIEELFVGLLVIILMIFFYIFFGFWFLWRLMRRALSGKPIAIEELSLYRTLNILYFTVLAPYTIPYWIICWIISVTKGVRHVDVPLG